MIFIIVALGIIITLVIALSLLKMLKPDKCPKCDCKNLITIDMDNEGTLYKCLKCGHKFKD